MGVITITLVTTLLNSASILNYHGKKVDSIEDESGNRIYTDDTLETIFNTIIEFVDLNAPTGTSEDLLKFAYRELCKIELNNRLFEDGYIVNWQYVDTFDKPYLMKLLETRISGQEPGQKIWVKTNVTEF